MSDQLGLPPCVIKSTPKNTFAFPQDILKITFSTLSQPYKNEKLGTTKPKIIYQQPF